MANPSPILNALTSEPTSTETLYDRVGYATLTRLGLIPYDAFRAELSRLAAAGHAEKREVEEGATLWRLPTPPEP
jgi:hypothetical protein